MAINGQLLRFSVAAAADENDAELMVQTYVSVGDASTKEESPSLSPSLVLLNPPRDKWPIHRLTGFIRPRL